MPAPAKPKPKGPKIPIRKPKTQLTNERALREPPENLNTRQRKLKKLLIQSRGMLNVNEAAKSLGVTRLTIWQDRRVITALSGPDQLGEWNEDAAIRRAIDFYESGMDVIMAELGHLHEAAEKRQRPTERQEFYFDTARLRISLYELLATYQRDLNQFLIAIGLIREAPKRLILDDERITRATTDEDIRGQIVDVRNQIAALRERREALAAATS